MTSTKKIVLLIFICAGGLVTASCNNPGTTKETTIDSPTTKPAMAPAGEDGALAFGGYLNELYVDSTTFTTVYPGIGNNKKLVMLWTFGSTISPTLHGWVAKRNGNDDEFDPTPDIDFLSGEPTTEAFGPNTYFGNEILRADTIRKIKIALRDNKAQFVMFRPKVTYNEIKFSIYVVKGDYKKDGGNANTANIIPVTNSTINPSPPRRYTIQ